MPLNNEYKRYFIILQEDDKGYEMAAGKIPTGYVKIEIKNGRGKLTAYAQNVKYGEKVDYRMLLIAPTKKAAVDMGRLMVDGSGRGELNIEFDADNVMKSGMGISDFMVAAIQTSTATPLSGYTGRDKMQWKNSYHIINKPQDRIDKKQQIVEEVVTPIQTKPMEMPHLPKVNLGNVVEGAKGVVEDVAEGAKNIVGGIKKGVKDVIEFVVDENEVKPAPIKPMEQVIPEPTIMPPSHVKSKKESIPIQVVTEPITMKPIVESVPIKPKKEPIPVQIVTEPVEMQPIVEPVPAPVPIIVPEAEPISVPEPMPEPTPVPIPIPVKPIEMLPQKPLFEAQTEIKAKFVIETEEKHEKPHYEYKIECPEIDYKSYYYDEDSDSDSDDRDKNEHHEHNSEDETLHDYEKNSFYTNPMYRRIEKVLGRLREYEPFDNDSNKRWFKIEDDVYLLNSATMPFMGSMMPLGYPFMSNECVMMIGRKDYIIGAEYIRDHKDKKYIKAIMFGIPGMNNKQEERYYRMRGFTGFRTHKSKHYGYWIMTVDVMSGEIVMK